MKQATWTSASPALHHVSIRVVFNQMENAIAFFQFLGWELQERKAEWQTGHSNFLNHEVSSIFLQLTVENEGNPGDISDASHVALAVENTEQAVAEITAWCEQEGIDLWTEEVGPKKVMIKFPFLYGAVEIVEDDWLNSLFASLQAEAGETTQLPVAQDLALVNA